VHDAFFPLDATLVFYPFLTRAFAFSIKPAAVWALFCVVCLSVQLSASAPVKHMNLMWRRQPRVQLLLLMWVCCVHPINTEWFFSAAFCGFACFAKLAIVWLQIQLLWTGHNLLVTENTVHVAPVASDHLSYAGFSDSSVFFRLSAASSAGTLWCYGRKTCPKPQQWCLPKTIL